MMVTGIDGYPRGWVAARLDPDTSSSAVHWATCEVSAIAALLHPDDVVGIDMPIGLVEHGWRECDQLARTALGRAGSRVFLTPPRAVLALGINAPNTDVQRVSRALTGQGVALARLPLVAEHLANGDLVEPLPQTRLDSPLAYWLMVAPRSAQRPEVKAFCDWIRRQAEITRHAIGDVPDPETLVDAD